MNKTLIRIVAIIQAATLLSSDSALASAVTASWLQPAAVVFSPYSPLFAEQALANPEIAAWTAGRYESRELPSRLRRD